ncbi:uncharacterized protein PG998_011813 [Apiospora kogelbergensis]|uniref:uncharacterized protein n=1 Tax=Apiospora kogelbergensis TaxID=1337665 RepID=UPI0031306E57
MAPSVKLVVTDSSKAVTVPSPDLAPVTPPLEIARNYVDKQGTGLYATAERIKKARLLSQEFMKHYSGCKSSGRLARDPITQTIYERVNDESNLKNS